MTLLPWAKEEVFSFVVYYKQRTFEGAQRRVGEVREPDDQVFLIDAVPPEMLAGVAGRASRRQVVQAVIGMVAVPVEDFGPGTARQSAEPARMAITSKGERHLPPRWTGGVKAPTGGVGRQSEGEQAHLG